MRNITHHCKFSPYIQLLVIVSQCCWCSRLLSGILPRHSYLGLLIAILLFTRLLLAPTDPIIPNTWRCKILPLQNNLMGDVGSLGLSYHLIAVRTCGHDSKLLHNKLHVLKHAYRPMPPWSLTLNDYQAQTTSHHPRAAKPMQIWFNDSFPDITSLLFLGFCYFSQGGDYPLEHVKNVSTFPRKM